MWGIEWKDVAKTLVTLVLGGLGGYLGRGLLELRRRIRFSAPRVYFGPALTFNKFMGRNYPSDSAVSFECDVRFFSEKSQTVGLHEFQLQLCRETYLGPVVEFVPDMQSVYRDLMKKDGPHQLDALELPPREFVSFELRTYIERNDWPKLRLCTIARLQCRSADGHIRRFKIGSIQWQDMPPQGVNGMEYMSVEIMPTGFPNAIDPKSLVILAARRREGEMTNLFTIPPEDTRYWDGTAWVGSKGQAKVYSKIDDARAEGERIKIWNIVPDEWMKK